MTTPCNSPGGQQKGPLTSGEARTLTAITTGCDPEEIAGFIVITSLKCADCGEPHHLITSTDLDRETTIAALEISLTEQVLRIMHGDDDRSGEL
jgi:hypothetical protein